MKSVWLLSAVLCAFPAFAEGATTHLLHSPAMNRSVIVFAYAGDLWSVNRQGGTATRLTSGPGVESLPFFSPDGRTIAFTGEYDGNVDLYTMPAAGGVRWPTVEGMRLCTLAPTTHRISTRRRRLALVSPR